MSWLFFSAWMLAGCSGVVMNTGTLHVTGYPLPVSPAAESERKAQADANAKALDWYKSST